jgi:high-affinity iron transporter
LPAWIAAIDSTLATVESLARAGDVAEASRLVVRGYLDYVEPIEGFYGAGAPYTTVALAERIGALESEFHGLMTEDRPAELAAAAVRLRADVRAVLALARTAGVPLEPAAPAAFDGAGDGRGEARTAEMVAIIAGFDAARAAHARGDHAAALAQVERTYLEQFEVLEPLVPGASVRRIESLIHLRLRPQLARGAPAADVQADFRALRAELLSVDAALARETPFWFAAVNSFAILIREGLEAVLLIGALLAYLGAIGAERVHHRRIYWGAGLGVAASFATWGLARTLVPVTGASRELLEGVTALIAVAVLLYVSHWLFQKTYIHDWKQYLRDRVGKAVAGGSVLAMAGLAFAAVYREGFETVLFYQALLFDAQPTAVLAGFVPGMLIIAAVGIAMVRLGLRLPIRNVFRVTNAILLYLAFVFLGKGLYNLQEGGLFSPQPLHWLPDSSTLQLLFGFYPVAQTVLAQVTLLGLLVVTWAIHRRRLAVGAAAVH